MSEEYECNACDPTGEPCICIVSEIASPPTTCVYGRTYTWAWAASWRRRRTTAEPLESGAARIRALDERIVELDERVTEVAKYYSDMRGLHEANFDRITDRLRLLEQRIATDHESRIWDLERQLQEVQNEHCR